MTISTLISVFIGLGVVCRTESFVVPAASARLRVGQSHVLQGSFGRRPARWSVIGQDQGLRCWALSMASTADFKNGLTINLDGNPCKIVEFLHVKPGKGSAFVRTKVRNLTTGNSLEKTFRAGEPIELAQVEKKELQFTYAEGNKYCFMDMQSYEEVTLDAEIIGDKAGFVMEGMTLEALYFEGKTIDVTIPRVMVFEVAETDPGAKGNTASGGSKPAKLESGAVVSVPLFIKQGEKIRVDTEEKKYMARANE